MAFCTDCTTSLAANARHCPGCGAPTRQGGPRGEPVSMNLGSLPTMESEVTIASARLFTPPLPAEGPLDRTGTAGAAGARSPAAWKRRSPAGGDDVSVSALVLGVVSVVFGLLGQGWFGIVAVLCGHQARRQIAGNGAGRLRTVLAMSGVVLGCVAIVMMLGSLVTPGAD